MMYLDDLARAISEHAEPDTDPEEIPYLLYLLYALLAKAKGTATTREDVHDAWSIWQQYDGDCLHRSIVPFDQLSPEVQTLDQPYVDAIHTAVGALRQPAPPRVR